MARRLKRKLEHRHYPWDQWLDGSTWRIEKGEDFDVDPENMRVQVHNAAKARGLKVVTHRKGGVIEFRSVDRKRNP